MTEYSCGHGGLMVEAQVRFADGTVETLETDGSWQARRNERFVAPHVYDGTRFEGEWRPACPVPSVWTVSYTHLVIIRFTIGAITFPTPKNETSIHKLSLIHIF